MRTSWTLGSKLHQLSNKIEPCTFNYFFTNEESQNGQCHDGP